MVRFRKITIQRNGEEIVRELRKKSTDHGVREPKKGETVSWRRRLIMLNDAKSSLK